MNKRTHFTLFFCLFFFCQIQAQKITLAGYIQDSISGERLIGATLHTVPDYASSTITNEFGFFSLEINQGKTSRIKVNYLGYESRLFELSPSQDTTLVFELPPSQNELSTVEVKAQNYALPKTSGTIVQITPKEIKQIPRLLGETDALRAFQLMPGIQGGSEGSSALHVRGGSPDQNLILLDDVPLYFANHIGGFVSVIDADAINSIRLYKGGFPARFAGRLSSVVDVRLKDGGFDKWKKQFSLGVLSSKISFSGPIKKDKVSALVTLRRSNLDLLTRIASLMNSGGEFSAGFYFYDGTAKINYKISERDRVYLSFYAGQDRLFIKQNSEDEFQGEQYTLKSRIGNNWGNIAGAIRWNHLYGERFFANYILSYSRFNYSKGLDVNRTVENTDTPPQKNIADLTSGIQDFSLKLHHEFHGKSIYRFGLTADTPRFRQPGIYLFQQRPDEENIEQSEGGKIRQSSTLGAYIEVEPELGKKLTMNIGLHTALFFTDKKVLPSLQPRFVANYAINENFSINTTYSRMVQNLHLLSNSGAGLPTDLWLPATDRVRPTIADQVSIGTQWNTNGFSFEFDAFYKKMYGQIDFRQGASFFTGGEDWQDNVEIDGKGTVYGTEFLLKKNTGKFNGWLAYTWSKNTRIFDNLNSGRAFPYKFDRPHVLDIVAIWQPGPKVSMSATWTLESGQAITLADAQYALETFDLYDSSQNQLNFEPHNQLNFGPHNAQLFDQRNNYRMPTYHRLDVNFNFTRKGTRKGKSQTRITTLGVYNLYNKHNPYFIFYDRNEQGDTSLHQFTLFPILPYISYELKF